MVTMRTSLALIAVAAAMFGAIVGALLATDLRARKAETCRAAVEQIVGPAESYDRDTTNRNIARCLDR